MSSRRSRTRPPGLPSLTQQLLAFSRQQVVRPVQLDLNEIVAEIERMLQRLIGEDVALAPGRGTSFGIYLPEADHAETSAAAPAAASPVGGCETILLVEDEASVRDLARRMLQESGYNVLSAANGSEALLLCAAHRQHIDLMVTDVVMPYIRGAELAQRVGHIRPGLPVLYMSGYTDDSIDPAISGSVCFLQKPFLRGELLGAVREALEAQAPSHSPEPDLVPLS